jgi:Lysozyme inhibitor LprI
VRPRRRRAYLCGPSTHSLDRMKARLFAPLLLLAVLTPALAQRSADAAQTCYALDGHADQRECLSEQAKQMEQQLESQEAATRAALLRADQVKTDINRAVEAFDKSASEYRRFKMEQCEFVAALAFGGNAQWDRRLLCQIELDAARIRYLSGDSKDAV